ncbi:hypothetical protein DRO66_05120 [Candidatus Bathyarchaeota archaeon]|nr:MAG: hypothetical protein DRO66_05120 [Candidatus Bathyarchaeota archaeon]
MTDADIAKKEAELAEAKQQREDEQEEIRIKKEQEEVQIASEMAEDYFDRTEAFKKEKKALARLEEEVMSLTETFSGKLKLPSTNETVIIASKTTNSTKYKDAYEFALSLLSTEKKNEAKENFETNCKKKGSKDFLSKTLLG